MAKFLSYLCAFLCLVVFIYYQAYGRLCSKNTALKQDILSLEQEKDILKQQLSFMENEIENYNEKQVEASNTIEKVREVIKTVKEPCNCYNTLLPDNVIKLLHENNKQ